MLRKILLRLILMLFTSPIFADVYKWQEASGTTNYSDTLPASVTRIKGTNKNTNDRIAGSESIRMKAENSSGQSPLNEAMDATQSSGLKVRNVSAESSTALHEQMRASVD